MQTIIVFLLAVLTPLTVTASATRIIYGDQIQSSDLSKTISLPPTSSTIIGDTATQTLSNKTVSGASNTFTNIPVAAIGGGAALSGTNTGDVTLGTANGLSLVGQALSLQAADATHIGALLSADWSTFNGKQAAGSYITALTGDVTASGPGSAAATLATVNGNVGSFTNASITVDGKGRITAASSGGGGGGGSVTSVALADGSTSPIFTISGSPVTVSGTLTETLSNQSANTIFAGPTAGGAAQPGFRAAVAADIPNLDAAKITTGVFPIARGGTNSGTALNNNRVMQSSGGAIVEAAAITAARALKSDANGIPVASTAIAADLDALSGSNSGDVTLGTANGLSLAGQALSLQAADATHTGALTSADWSIFNGKQAALSISNLTDAGADGITVTGGTGAVIGSGTSLAQHIADATHNGYLSSGDWSTFNSKQAALTPGNISTSTTGVSVGSGTNSTVGPNVTVDVQTATGAQPGLLSAADWTTFNGKQAADNYITALTGDVTSSGPGSVAATIAALAVTNAKIANATIDLTSKVTGVLPAANGGAAVVTKVLYVDGNRSDSYTADGSFSKPFLTIQPAINQIIANADNATFPYQISIAPGGYSGTLTLNNALLRNITIGSTCRTQAETPCVSIGPGTGTAITSTSTNTNLQNLVFADLTINGNVVLTGDITATNFCGGACMFLADNIQKDATGVILTNANNVYFYDTAFNSTGTGPITFNNIAFGLLEQGDGIKSGTTLHLIDNPGGNVPAQYGGNYLLVQRATMSATTDIDAGSELDLLNGFTGGTITNNGTIHAYGHVFTNTITNNSGSTFRNRGSFYSGTFTANAGSTIQNQGKLGFTPGTAGDWNSAPTEVFGALNTLASSGIVKSQAQNLVLASPNGSAGVSAFRALVSADIPNLDAAKITTGTFPIARGGTNSATALNNNRVMQSSGGAIVEAAAITASRALKSDANGIPVASTATAASLDALSGTNTGDQTITLTGDVTGSGTGSFAATIAALAVTNAKIANATIDLTSKVTGVLPIANGGYGTEVQETPSGTINSSNVTFTLANTPSASVKVKLYQDGIFMTQGTDYTISSATITMTTAPATGQTLDADYIF